MAHQASWEEIAAVADEMGQADVWERLRAFYGVHDSIRWLTTPHAELGGETALACVRMGRAQEVIAVIERMAGGVYS